MNEAAALGFFISVFAGIAALGYAFVIFLLLLFINSHTKEIRDQLVALNAALRTNAAPRAPRVEKDGIVIREGH